MALKHFERGAQQHANAREHLSVDRTFDNAPVGIAYLSTDGRWLRVNRRLAELLARPPDELVGRSLFDLARDEDAADHRAALQRLVDGEVPALSRTIRLRHLNRAVPWVSMVASRATARDRGDEAILAVFEDATERVETERRLRVQFAVSRVLAEAESVERALPRVLAAIGEHLGWRFGAFWTVGEGGDRLHLAATWRSVDHESTTFERATRDATFERGVGIPGRVWFEGRAVWVEDVVRDANFPRQSEAVGEGLHAAFAFPVRVGFDFLGVLEFFSDRIRSPSEALLGVADGVGYQIGQFLARRRAAESQRDEEARRAAVLETALDSVITIDHTGRVREWNAASEVTFGYTREQAIGVPMSDLIVPPALREAHARGLARYLATGVPHLIGRRVETTAVRADGTELPIELAITRVALPGPPMFTAYLRDVGARKRSEARQRVLLEASERLASSLDYEATLRNLTRVIIPALADWYIVDLLDRDGTVRRVQVAHGDPEREALAERLAGDYAPEEGASAVVREVLATGESRLVPSVTEEDLRHAARDDRHLAVLRSLGFTSYLSVPLRSHDGVLGVITLMSAESGRHYDPEDLALAEELARRAAHAIENARLFEEVEDGRRALEDLAMELEAQREEVEAAAIELQAANEHLREANDALARQTDAAEHARREADEANRAKSEFLAAMSHELRTPLNAISGYAQLLTLEVRGPISAAQREDLRRIERSAQLLLGLITDILNFAKLEAGRLQYDVEEFSVNEALATVGELIAPQLGTKKLSYEYRPGDVAVTAHADRDKVQQIVLNLLSNAVHFTPTGGRITVDWSADERAVRIRVRDTGIGIVPDKLEAIFEPFVQVGREYAGQRSGTGLGLAISRELARGMGGDLTVESTLDVGSTFTVTLQRGDARRPPAAAPASAAPAGE